MVSNQPGSDAGPATPAPPVRPVGGLGAAVLTLGAFLFLVPGVWAYVAPVNFQENVAPWADLGEHFLRDAGAFQAGLGAMVLAVLFWRDAVMVVLVGLLVATVLHAVSHLIDADYGTAVALGVAGLIFLVAFVLRLRRRPEPVGTRPPR